MTSPYLIKLYVMASCIRMTSGIQGTAPQVPNLEFWPGGAASYNYFDLARGSSYWLPIRVLGLGHSFFLIGLPDWELSRRWDRITGCVSVTLTG